MFRENHFIVIDNAVLVLLTEYYCDRNKGLQAQATIEGLKEWISERLAALKTYAVDGQLHTSDLVAAEYLPGAGRLGSLSGISNTLISQLRNRVLGDLNCAQIDPADVAWIRALNHAPASLGAGLNRLSNQDLSLVNLGLEHTENDTPAFVLSLDADLLALVAWISTNKDVKARHSRCHKMQGLHCLAYIEGLHRDCTVESTDMADLIGFAVGEHMNRVELAGTQKGTTISNHLMGIHRQMAKSIKVKTAA